MREMSSPQEPVPSFLATGNELFVLKGSQSPGTRSVQEVGCGLGVVDSASPRAKQLPSCYSPWKVKLLMLSWHQRVPCGCGC